METTEKAIDVLNDLIKINNDRVAGFENAAAKLEKDGSNLRPTFEKLAGESRDNSNELTHLATSYGGDAAEGTSTSGTLHRAWIDVKATFTGHDTESILDECERGEDAIKKAYRDALEDETELSPEVLQILRSQQQGIIAGHDLIKSLRDQSKNFSDNDSSPSYAQPVADNTTDVGDYQSEEVHGTKGGENFQV